MRLAARLPTIVALLGLLAPAAAEERPQTITTTLDLMRLQQRVNVDGTERVEPLGAHHEELTPRPKEVPGKVTYAEPFVAKESQRFEVEDARPIRDVSYEAEVGALLSVSREAGLRLRPRVDVASVDLAGAVAAAQLLVKGLKPDGLREELRKRGAPVGGKANELAERLELVVLIEAMKPIEALLVREKVIPKEKARAFEMDHNTKGTAVRDFANALGEVITKALSYKVEIRYALVLEVLGSGPEDGPGASFVPGQLEAGVSQITVVTELLRGRPRVLWYRLPGYDAAQQEVAEVKAPEGWLWRVTGAGPETRGARVFIIVPRDGEGRFEFVWQRKAAGAGAKLVVHRPPARLYPY